MHAAGTAPTFQDGSPAGGTITAKGAILFQAGSRKTALEITITVPGDATYTIASPGGVADPSQSPLGSFDNAHFGDLDVTSTGAACSGPNPCKVGFRGFVGGGVGANATARAVFVFSLGSGKNEKSLRGAFVLKAQ